MLTGYICASETGDGQTLASQRDALLDAGVHPNRLYEDRRFDKRDDRPALKACLRALQAGDTLVIWRLDQLGCNLGRLVRFMHKLAGRGMGLQVLAGPGAGLSSTAADGGLVLAALAEFDREQTAKRTRPGLSLARAGKGGRSRKMTPVKLQLAQTVMGQNKAKMAELCRELGVTRQTLYRHVAPNGTLRPYGERLLDPTSVSGPQPEPAWPDI